jgi:hypothetical protein
MSTRSRIRKLFVPRRPRALGKFAHSRPAVEALECRLAPAYVAFTSPTGPANPFHGFDAGDWSAPALVDVDGDGDRDAVVGEANGRLIYFKNTGTVTSPVYAQQTGAANPFNGVNVGIYSAPALGDVDGDGDLDALVGAHDGTLRYFWNTGTATSPVYVQQTGAANLFNGFDVGTLSRPALGDVDGDGDLDAVVGEAFGKLIYLENVGTATIPSYSLQTGAANPFNGITVGAYAAPALGDADGDGDPDALVGVAEGTLHYLRNTGTATGPVYAPQTGAANPFHAFDAGFASAPAWGDVDGDGDLDAVVGGDPGTLSYFRSGIVLPAVNYTRQTGAANAFLGLDVGDNSRPALGDVDGDGDLDAVVGDYFGVLAYFRNVGTATSPVYAPQTGAANPFHGIDVGALSKPALGDIDGDGDLDAVVGEYTGTLHYFKNTGTATSPAYAQQSGAANPFHGFDVGDVPVPALGDLDGDGDLDALVGVFEGPLSYALSYLKNTGTATSPVYERRTGPANPFNGINVGFEAAPALGDVDGDGDLDAVVGEGYGTLSYLKNTGTASSPAFTRQTGPANPFNGIDFDRDAVPALGDVDGDGDFDAVVGEGYGQLVYFRANRAPVVNNAIPDQLFNGPGVQSYMVPANAFLDLDNNPLTYRATLAGGADLPAWLAFDPATRTFSGNPEGVDALPIAIRVTATDPEGKSVSDDFRLTDSPAPAITRTLAAVTVNEGSPATNTGTFDDLQGHGTVTLTASLGTVARNDGAGTWSWTHTATADGPAGLTTVTITATDTGGLTASTTFTLTVNNVAPTIAISGAGSSNEGATYTLMLGALTDPGSDTVTQYRVHWGDGSSDTYTTAGAKTHAYDGPATMAITVDLVDEDGTHTNRANPLSVTVNNVAPTITTFTVPTFGAEGSPLSFSAAATDPGGAADPLSFRWTIKRAFGGTITLFGPSVAFTPTDDDGLYYSVVTLAVSDDDGANTTRTAWVNVYGVSPTATFAGPARAALGTPVTFHFTGVSDPSSADTAAGFRYYYDFTGDGTYDLLQSANASASFSYATPGTYTVSGMVEDKDGFWAEYTTTVVVVAPPRVQAVEVNGGAAQRSMVTGLTVAFDGLVTLPAVPATAFRLERGDGTVVTLAVDLSGSTSTQTVARLSFSGPGVVGGSLADGRYTLTILRDQVSDPDGNRMEEDRAEAFHRLYGDVTGDRTVNGADFNPFRLAFGAGTGHPNYRADFDVNGDGVINGADFNEFRTRFGLSI